MRSIYLSLVAIALTLAAASDRAQAQDLRLNLMREDSFASRRIQVFKKPDEKLSGVVSIESFDAGSNSFTMRGIAGDKVKVAATDLEKIEFEQELLKQRPQAQSAFFEVSTQPGAALRYKIVPEAIKIDAGDLIVPASAPSAKISLSSTPVKPEHEGGSIDTKKIVEARKLTWDAASKSFLVDVQEVTYSRATFGGGGASGMVK
jgi:hypothetical protein